MLRKFVLVALVCCAVLSVDCSDAAAGRRRGLFSRIRANQTQRYNRSRSYSRRDYAGRSSTSKLHLTNSRSAILDGFFGPYPGAEGHDSSWYVGK